MICRVKELDGRKLDHKTLEAIRMRAVKQVVAGESPETVIKALGFTRCCIYNWIAKYKKGGWSALKAIPLTGRTPSLSGKQLQKLYGMITEKNPTQLNFEFALWTRSMVGELIRKKFKVTLDDTTVGRVLHKLGLSPQKPLRRAYQRDQEKVEVWQEEAYPEIKRIAKKERAEVYFGDEANVRSDYHSGTTWAPVGKTPTVTTTGARFSLNMVSAISAKGQMRFMTFEGKMNSERFIDFLKRLLYRAKRPVYLILDGHPVHKSRKVKEYVATTEGKLRLFILPPYSTHLNPDEWVWNWLKKHKLGKARITGPDQLKELAMKYMHKLQKLPDIIRGFFLDKNLTYITS